MNVSRNLSRRFASIVLVVLMAAVFALGQQGRGTLRGIVKDELGGTVTGATVTLIDQTGTAKTATTNGEGAYVFNGLTPGKYSVTASATGFAVTDEVEVDVVAGQRPTLDLTLKVTIEEQKVTIAAATPLSTDSTDNANQTLITGKDANGLGNTVFTIEIVVPRGSVPAAAIAPDETITPAPMAAAAVNIAAPPNTRFLLFIASSLCAPTIGVDTGIVRAGQLNASTSEPEEQLKGAPRRAAPRSVRCGACGYW